MELTTAVAGRHLIITSEFEASDIVHNLVAQFVPNMERCGGQLFSGPVAKSPMQPLRALDVKSWNLFLTDLFGFSVGRHELTSTSLLVRCPGAWPAAQPWAVAAPLPAPQMLL